MKKTLQNLNQHWLYRLVKVVYGSFFLLLVIVTMYFTWTENMPKEVKDYNKSLIICNNGNKYTFDKLNIKDSFGISLFTKSGATYNKAFSACQSPSDININDNSLVRYQNEDINFSTLYKMKKEGNWFKPIGYSMLLLIIINAAYKVIQGLFYYIILGNFKPKK